MDTMIAFSPERAWQSVLRMLELDMARQTFHTFVRPLQLLEVENNTFTIGCEDVYGRDWVESRLTTMLERNLSGILGTQVKVIFVMLEEDDEEESNEECAEAGSPEEPEIAAEMPEIEKVSLQTLEPSLRDTVQEPGRVVRLPIYWLRWLPYMDAQVLFVVMAFWQEYYFSNGGKLSSPRVSTSAERICQWAGISRAQFFRLLQPGSTLGWFVQKRETSHERDRRNGRAKKSSNQYLLCAAPLTPGDAEDLSKFLEATGIRDAPLDALQKAVELEPRQILSYPLRSPPDGFAAMSPCWRSVQDVVRDLVGHPLEGELAQLTDRLADRLLAKGDFLLVSWYFLKHWLPLLGAQAAMFVLLLRRLCYFNDETGEIRNEVWIEGGYAGIAARLGTQNPRRIAHWLPAAIEHGQRIAQRSERSEQEVLRRRQLQELLGFFVRRTGQRPNDFGGFAWKFRVERHDPLTPTDELVWQAADCLLAKAEAQGVLDELAAWVDAIPGREINAKRKIVLLRLMQPNDCSETLKYLLNDCFETLKGQKKDCFETLLKILKCFKDSNKQDTSPTPEFPEQAGGETWSLESLLAKAGKHNRAVLLSQESSAQSFVSWLIYGASQPQIQNPLSLAIARLNTSPRVGAGGASERLAAKPAAQLAEMVRKASQWQMPMDRDWRMLFENCKRERIVLLADALGIALEVA